MDEHTSTKPAELPTVELTPDAIQAARAAFVRRAQEAADSMIRFDEDIVIARNVTLEQVHRVEKTWLCGIKTMLRADGSLVITKLATGQHNAACRSLANQLNEFIEADDRFTVDREWEFTFPDGTVAKPDVALNFRRTTRGGQIEPFVLMDVEIHQRSVGEIIERARVYFAQLPSIEHYVGITMYPLCLGVLLRVSAVAVVLQRGKTEANKVEVVQVQSFGNAPIDERVFDDFVDARFPLSDLQAAASWLPQDLNANDPDPQLDALAAQPNHKTLLVDMPEEGRAIPIDLVKVFVEAMRGWVSDRAPAEI